MPTYTVKPGDCISSIADQSGFFWETLWNHPGNAALKKQRQNANALQPDDVVFIPDKRRKEESCDHTKRHVFRLLGVPVTLNLRLLDHDGNARAGVPYSLDVDGKKTQGNVPADGRISQVISPKAKKAMLTLRPPGAPQEDYTFQLGYMNPVDDSKGIQGRLRNLGYYKGDITGDVDQATTDAIKDFQHDSGLEVTGEADEATKSALAQRHGG